MMLLKLATTVLASILTVPASPSGATASFVYGINDVGGESFDLQVPASQWPQFAHGERLDVAHHRVAS